MNIKTTALRVVLARWRVEDASVADIATGANLRRIRAVTLIVAALNVVHFLAFGWQWTFHSPQGNAGKWTLALLALHAAMCCAMLLIAFVAHSLRFATRSPWVRGLSLSVAGVAFAFSIAVVTVDQWITPGVTPFLLCCIITSVVLFLKPVHAAMIFACAYSVYFWALSLTQGNAEILLSNRLNGMVACMMGFTLSVMLWRKFVTITLQQAQLERANAELQLKQRELERLTRMDGLTGLFNRNTFVELTRTELKRAKRQGSATALLLLDLDHFKNVNDTWGHPAGDAVLRHVASVAAKAVRNTDLVGRLGGEEFIVLLPATTLASACAIAEKLRLRLQASAALWESHHVAVTASIGVSATSPQGEHNFDSLYNEADKALYMAKTRGRNRVMP